MCYVQPLGFCLSQANAVARTGDQLYLDRGQCPEDGQSLLVSDQSVPDCGAGHYRCALGHDWVEVDGVFLRVGVSHSGTGTEASYPRHPGSLTGAAR